MQGDERDEERKKICSSVLSVGSNPTPGAWFTLSEVYDRCTILGAN